MTTRYSDSQIAQCSVDAEGNIVDPITDVIIDPTRLISVPEGPLDKPVYYCFDVGTLYNWVQQGKKTNPYTRVPLSKNILDRIDEFGKSQEIEVIPLYATSPPYPLFDTGLAIGQFLLLLLHTQIPTSLRSLNFDIIIENTNASDLDLNRSLASYYPDKSTISVLIRSHPEVGESQRFLSILESKEYPYEDEHIVSLRFSGDHTSRYVSLQSLIQCFDLITGQVRRICSDMGNIQPSDLPEIRNFVDANTLSTQILADDYRKHFTISKNKSLSSLLLRLVSILPGTYDSVGYYNFIDNQSVSLYDSPRELPISLLYNDNKLMIKIIQDVHLNGDVINRRAQIIYNIAMDNNMTGIADRIYTVYPGITPRVTNELTGAALEQQRRIQERNLDLQLARAVDVDDLVEARNIIQMAQQRNQPIDFDTSFMVAIERGHIDMVQLLGSHVNPLTVGSPYEDMDLSLSTDVPLFISTYKPSMRDRVQIVRYLLYTADDVRLDLYPVREALRQAHESFRQTGNSEYSHIAMIIDDYITKRYIRNNMQYDVRMSNLAGLHRRLDKYSDIGMDDSFDWIVRNNPEYLAVKMFLDRGYIIGKPLSYYLTREEISLETLDLFLQNGIVIDNPETIQLLDRFPELRTYIQQHPHGEYIAFEGILLPPPKCCDNIYEYAYYGKTNDVDRIIYSNRHRARIINEALRGAIAGGNLSLVQKYVPDPNTQNGNLIIRAAGSTANPGASEILLYLISKGANLRLYGLSAMGEATRSGNIANVKILLGEGVPANSGAMLNAATLDYVNILTLLLNVAPYDEPNIDRLMFEAAKAGSIKCVNMLLRYGADIRGPTGNMVRQQVKEQLSQYQRSGLSQDDPIVKKYMRILAILTPYGV